MQVWERVQQQQYKKIYQLATNIDKIRQHSKVFSAAKVNKNNTKKKNSEVKQKLARYLFG